MRAIGTAFVAVAAIGLVLAGCGGDDDAKTTSATLVQPTVFNVPLTGTDEVPGPGDLAGDGTARISVDPKGTQICFVLTVSGIQGVNAAHIHEGTTGVAGPIVATLATPATGQAEGCIDADKSLIKTLSAGSKSYYVNIHSAAFPDGAIRGQLSG